MALLFHPRCFSVLKRSYTVFLKAVYFFSGIGRSFPSDKVTWKRLITIILIALFFKVL